MNDQPPLPPRARLQALLAIPERQRTDAQWDELNELEIMLASGNRPGAPEQNVRPWNNPTSGGHPNKPGGGGGGGGQRHGKRSGRKFQQRPPKRHGP